VKPWKKALCFWNSFNFHFTKKIWIQITCIHFLASYTISFWNNLYSPCPFQNTKLFEGSCFLEYRKIFNRWGRARKSRYYFFTLFVLINWTNSKIEDSLLALALAPCAPSAPSALALAPKVRKVRKVRVRVRVLQKTEGFLIRCFKKPSVFW
jgi:hypothetical protein